MNIFDVVKRFGSQEDCIKHLEYLRFDEKPYCPHCEGYKVARKREKKAIGRWNCYECGSSFNVLSGTIFEKTRTPLPTWFAAIAIFMGSKKGISSHQIARYLGISQDNAWRMLKKIRGEMFSEIESLFLSGTVEADETYANIRTDEVWGRGRGSNKLKVLGAVERGGEVAARRVLDVTGETMKKFMMTYLHLEDAVLITDHFKAYNRMNEIVKHKFMKKGRRGQTTSVIEGFWAIYKRSLYGTYHKYEPDNSDLYLSEACFRYNNRKYTDSEVFDYFLKICVFKHSNRIYHLLEGGFHR